MRFTLDEAIRVMTVLRVLPRGGAYGSFFRGASSGCALLETPGDAAAADRCAKLRVMTVAYPLPLVELEDVFRRNSEAGSPSRPMSARPCSGGSTTPVAAPAPSMTACRVPAGPMLEALGVDGNVVFEVGPCELGDFPPEAQAEIRRFEADKAAGQARVVPHAEVLRQLEERIRREHGSGAA